MNTVAQGIGEVLKVAAEYGPEIELLLSAIINHNVSREEVRAAVRDLVVKKSDEEMRKRYPDQDPNG